MLGRWSGDGRSITVQPGLVVSFAHEGDVAYFIDAMRAAIVQVEFGSLVVFASEVAALHFVRGGLGDMLSPNSKKSEAAN